MSTTLPLFWHLSAASRKERLDASVQLIGALEHFQAQHAPKASSETSDDEDEQDAEVAVKTDHLDLLNAQDVSYSIRRLIRGLASPRESSRLGFAVALTELLSRIDTVTCSQMVALILDSSKTQGSMSGQEERDVLFARLFGLTAVIQSGLLTRNTPLPASASSSALTSSAASYEEVLSELTILGEKKSWLREGAWWAIGLAVDSLSASNISWEDEAVEATIQKIFVDNKIWTPEKVALTLKLQTLYPKRAWQKWLSPTFKISDLLSTGNLTILARILKESSSDDDDEGDSRKSASGTWKPQVHFVWDLLLDQVLSAPSSDRRTKGSFPEFFRIVVDESLFSSTASPERKYWGFQIFQKALPRVSATDMPMLFTKNFMRSWINHLSNSDRYLHKIAKQVANDILAVVKSNPTIGFTLILQLTGVHGSRQFDKLTKTKTVETILTSMDKAGIQTYIDYLLDQVNDEHNSDTADVSAINGRRAWIIDQLAALIRNGAIPRDDEWMQSILDWFVVHGLFIVNKKSEKSVYRALHRVPTPVFSDELRKGCRERLLSCVGELTGHSTIVKGGDSKTLKASATAADGQFWISKVLHTIQQLEADQKHVSALVEMDEDESALRQKTRELTARLDKAPEAQREAARGAELLLSATLLHRYCADDDAADPEVLESCIDGTTRMFPVEVKKQKKSRKSAVSEEQDATPEPVDVLVDTVIGFLEEATAYMRAVANQVFTLLSGSVQESTIDLILTQLERRSPEELIADDGDEDMDEDGEDEGGEEESNEEVSSAEDEDEDEDADEEEDLELRRKIEEALRVNGVEAATGDSDEEEDEDLMDDDQMMAIDEQLAAVFKARAGEKKSGKDVDAQREATHFKNRVLDLLEIFMKKQPTSPLVVRLILPLVELIVSTGADEKQLADKATGILRSRIGKLKETPSSVDTELVTAVIQEVHLRARKAHTTDVVATLSQCSLYLSKCLIHAGQEQAILAVYRESLTDFVGRKASRLNLSFFLEFIRRHPGVAWRLRNDLIENTGKAINVYRQCQVFVLLQTLISQLPVIGDHQTEIVEFMPTLHETLHRVMSAACDETATLTPPQMKELFKLGLLAIRQTKRVSTAPEEVIAVWQPSSWETLGRKLVETDRFKSSTGLHTMCKQMVQTSGQPAKADKTVKRKAASLDEEDSPVTPKTTKRKKVKKSKV